MPTDFDIAEYISKSVLIVPIIIGIVQAVKYTGLSAKWSPLISIAAGLLIAYLTSPATMVGHNFLAGIIYGLSASGLYSGVATVVSKTTDQPRDEQGRFTTKE